MPQLSEVRCLNHSRREAVARCPACGRFFCRECITEHEHRVLCAACLRALAPGTETGGTGLAGLSLSAGAAAGLLLIWVLFYLAGQVLLLIPSSFHEGTGWEVLWQGRL